MSDSDSSEILSDGEEQSTRKRHYDDEAEEVDDNDISDNGESEPSSDEAENLDDEEEEDERPAKRQKRTGVHNFIIDEADVDEDEEEEEDEEGWEDGAREIIENDMNHHGEDLSRNSESHRKLHNAMEEEDYEQMANYYTEKYQNNKKNQRVYDDEVSDDITQQQLLPDVKDPNMWTLKCRMGEEKATAMLLMRKFITSQQSTNPLQIKSVVVPEGLKGYIYIEAIKQTHLKQAIEGVSNLRLGYYNQKMVPTKEMPDVLKVIKDFDRSVLKPFMWVRIKKGMYKDDLAQIQSVQQSMNQVTLKYLPRIDYDKLINNKRSENGFKKPPPKLFNFELIRQKVGGIVDEGDYYRFANGRYDEKGFTYKNFSINALMVDGIKPTLAELEKFEQEPEGLDIELSQSTASKLDKVGLLSPGDIIKVSEGELCNLKGKLIKVEGNRVTMLPIHEDLREPLEFQCHEVKKFFQTGDHVKVINGKYENDTGLILSVESNLVVVLADLTLAELKVLPQDLQLCPDVSSGVDSVGKFQFGDLVHIENKTTVGVIVRLEKEHFNILCVNGKTKHLRHQEVSRKNTNRTQAVALDSNSQSIQCKDIVKVVDGFNSGKEGEVKHLFRGNVFIHSRKSVENAGIFVCKSRQLVLAGSSKSASMGGFVPMSPRISSPARGDNNRGGGGGNRSRGGFRGGRGGRSQRDTGMIGKTVVVKQGPYKGHYGVVKDATETTARVELHASCQTINVDTNRLKVAGSTSSSVSRRPSSYSSAAATPLHTMSTPSYTGSKTPVYGSQTPTHDGSRTPHYGGQTPQHDGSRTPRGMASAWDANNPNTPSPHTDFDYEQSPAGFKGSITPNVNTPSYDQSPADNFQNPGTPSAHSNVNSPFAVTPSPQSYDVTPSPMNNYSGGYQPTPSPAAPNPMSVSTYDNPSSNTTYNSSMDTPYRGPYDPSPLDYSNQTPGSYRPPNSVDSINGNNNDWHTADIYVNVTHNVDDPSMAGKKGVIRNITGGLCNVYLPEEKRTVTIPSVHLEPSLPVKQDKVKVILGEDREATGELISIDDKDGIVRMDADKQLKILQLRYLGTIATQVEGEEENDDN